jgi:hypothetical protein
MAITRADVAEPKHETNAIIFIHLEYYTDGGDEEDSLLSGPRLSFVVRIPLEAPVNLGNGSCYGLRVTAFLQGFDERGRDAVFQ